MKCLFLINPVSGAREGRKLMEALQLWSLPGIIVTAVLIEPRRLFAQVHSLVQDKDVVVIAGGDGAISMVFSALADLAKPPPVALVPLGTGNDMARSSGWLDIWQSGGLDLFFPALKEAVAREIDLWHAQVYSGHGDLLSNNRFIAYLGFGLDASICEEMIRIKERVCGAMASRQCTRLSYLLAGLKHMVCHKVFSASISVRFAGQDAGNTMQTQDPDFRGTSLIFSNISSYAGGSLLPGKGDFSDSALEFYRYRGNLGFVLAVLTGRLRKSRQESINRYSLSMARIELKNSVTFQADGEFLGTLPKNSIIDIDLFRKLPFLVPPDDFYVKQRLFKPVYRRFYGFFPACPEESCCQQGR